MTRTRLAPYLMILPGLALALWIVGWPLVEIVRASIFEVNRFGQLRDFAGTANYAALAGDPVFWGSLWRTFVWTTGVVIGTLLLALPIALILNEDFIGRGVARVIVMLPWAVSLTMTAVVWRWALNGQNGMLNATLFRMGLMDQRIEWLATAEMAFPIEIAIGILVSIPFTVTVFLGGLSSVPDELYEAARIDGATGWQRFRHITFPLLAPFLNLALVLNVIHVFNSFPIIWVLTQGDPANSTDILVTYLYKLAFRYGKLDEASAMSVIMFAVLLCLIFIYVWMVLRERREQP